MPFTVTDPFSIIHAANSAGKVKTNSQLPSLVVTSMHVSRTIHMSLNNMPIQAAIHLHTTL